MTINLQQAKRLSELGVRKKAGSYWCTVNENHGGGKPRKVRAEFDLSIYNAIYPAYNAEELISMIKGGYDINVSFDKMVQITAWCDKFKGYDYFKGATLTEALANKLIFDIENGIVSIEDINK